MKIIHVDHVTKRFKEQLVIQETSMYFESGRIHGIIGHNGSGKTVFLKMLCGLLCPSNGQITVNGKVLGKDVDFAPNTGIIIETPSFFPYKSGFNNLRDLARIRKKIEDERIVSTIKMVGLDPNSRKWVGKYSLGMRQRLGIAQAIMEDPDILILDEPMNGLDHQGQESMRHLFLALRNEGKTIILASHNAEDIEVLCDEVYKMDAGILTKQ